MLEAFDLSYHINGKTVFSDLEFSLNQGQLLQLKGGNGAGKTTLLKAIGKLISLDGGTIHLNKRCIDEIYNYPEKVGYIGHKLGLHPKLTVLENLNCWQAFNQKLNEITPTLEANGLLGYKDYYVYELSEGLKKRVSLTAIELVKKDIWLLDEPFVAIDKPSQDLFANVLEKILGEGAYLFLSSHQPFNCSVDHILNLELCQK